MIISDLFEYFALFVPKSALQKVFHDPTYRKSDYNTLKPRILNADDTRRFNEGTVTDYIFGTDEEYIRRRLEAVSGPYLFVEYSAITSYINAYDVKIDKMHIGATMALPTPEDADQFAMAMVMDEILQNMKTMRDTMRSDYDLGKIWLPQEASTLTPFHAKQFANSNGWTLEWNAEFIDLV